MSVSRRFLLCLAMLLLAFQVRAAENWPSKTMRIIVPTAAGSSVDIVARVVGEKLGPLVGQSVIVENKPGANGVIGTDAVVNARDGHTLLLAYNGPLTVSPLLRPKPPYEVQRDLAPIILAVTQPNVLAVRADLKVNSVKELIALAKSRPGTLDYASVGLGSLSNLAMELLKMKSGTYMLHIPFNGGPPAALALARGDAQLMFGAYSNVQALVKDGKVKLLAVSNGKRSAVVPDLPTVAESGFPGFDATTWNGFLAPASMPLERVQSLNRMIGQILAMPDVRHRLATVGAEPAGGTPAQFSALIARETAAWADVIERSGIKLE